MTTLAANCPSCAAPIEFKGGSTLVLVCPYCRSAVARTDRGLEDIGKVAEIVESQSPLKLGLKGIYRNISFQLTGRAQIKHELGGVWDEWYATFSNGWVGWLAEAQGRFYFTFYQPLKSVLPSFADLQLGQVVAEIPNPTPLMVQEKGRATTIAAEGEIPYKLVPGETFEYADLAGKNNTFATIDYSLSPPWAFVGAQVTLDEIGLAGAKPYAREAKRVSSAVMSCPNCGGPLSLNAPDSAMRVTCPNCSSLLDVNQGNLSYLKSLTPPANAPDFVAPIGAEGTFAGDVKFKIIGATVRSVTFDGVKYFWHEYLLYNPMIGFRWLVHSDNHWNFVEPVNAAEIEVPSTVLSGKPYVRYNGKVYKAFQDAPATVEYVKGEFYWRVEQGETVRAIDYIAPPMMLSQEISVNEVNWSAGTYMTNEEIEKAFNIRGLPRPWGTGPNQPFTGQFYYTWGALPLLALIVVAIFLLPFNGLRHIAHRETITLPASAAPQQRFSQPFELKGNRNIRIWASAPISNSTVDLDVDLINDQSQEIESVTIPISYYQGVEDGEGWSEGSTSNYAALSSLPAGRYLLRIEGTTEGIPLGTQLPIMIMVEQNVNRGVNFICALVILSIVPGIGLLKKFSFESARWRDSMFNSSGG